MLTLFRLARLYKLANMQSPEGPEQKIGKFG